MSRPELLGLGKLIEVFYCVTEMIKKPCAAEVDVRNSN